MHAFAASDQEQVMVLGHHGRETKDINGYTTSRWTL